MTLRFAVNSRDWFKQRPVLTLAFGIGVFCSVLAVLFLAEPPNDVTTYYGRLTREFAAGNYDRAFYHMIPPLVPVLGGLVAKSGVDAFTALKIVSSLFFLAGLWPFNRLMRRVLPAHLVPWACLLYVICPRLVRYGTMGSLESAKVFFLLLLFERAVSLRDGFSWKKTVVLGAGAAGLCLARGEGIFLLPAIFMVILVAACRQRRSSTGVCVGQAAVCSLNVILICLVLSAPWLAYQYKVVGVPSFDSREVYAGAKILSKVGLTEDPPRLKPVTVYGAKRELERPEDERTVLRDIREFFKGLYPAYLLIAVLGLFVIRRGTGGTLTWIDGLCAFVIFYNAGLFAVNSHITKRYVATTIPFILGWTTVGGSWLVSRVLHARFRTRVLRRRMTTVGVTLFILVCIWDATLDIRPSWPPEPYVAKEVGEWVGRNRSRLNVNPGPPLQSADWGVGYHTGKQPVIAGYTSQYSYWADADLVLFDNAYEYPYAAVVAVCDKQYVDILITGKYWLQLCPTFSAKNEHFQLLESDWDEYGVKIYSFLGADD